MMADELQKIRILVGEAIKRLQILEMKTTSLNAKMDVMDDRLVRIETSVASLIRSIEDAAIDDGQIDYVYIEGKDDRKDN
jgi:hypothetical protein